MLGPGHLGPDSGRPRGPWPPRCPARPFRQGGDACRDGGASVSSLPSVPGRPPPPPPRGVRALAPVRVRTRGLAAGVRVRAGRGCWCARVPAGVGWRCVRGMAVRSDVGCKKHRRGCARSRATSLQQTNEGSPSLTVIVFPSHRLSQIHREHGGKFTVAIARKSDLWLCSFLKLPVWLHTISHADFFIPEFLAKLFRLNLLASKVLGSSITCLPPYYYGNQVCTLKHDEYFSTQFHSYNHR